MAGRPGGTQAPRIGVHVSVAGGLNKAIGRAQNVGADVMQIFLANPRGWAQPATDDDADRAFGNAAAGAGIEVFVHAPYLINLGAPSDQTLHNSIDALAFSLRRAHLVGAHGVVLHAGSSVGQDPDSALEQVRSALLPTLDAAPGDVPVLIEPTAGGGGALAHDAASLGRYLDAIGRDERVGVCLDTCHLHAAGHDLSSVDGFARALRSYRRAAGAGRIRLVHANDSRDPAGSRRDRHALIGHGTIGREPFGALFAEAATRTAAFVSESPDIDHANEIATLHALHRAALLRGPRNRRAAHDPGRSAGTAPGVPDVSG